MDPETIRYEKDGAVATITLARPDRRNALDLRQAEELAQVAIRCGTDRELKAVLLTAEGPAFHVGGDVSMFAAADDLPSTVEQLTLHLHGALARFRRMAPPLVVAVNGAAAGAGLGIAMAGDVVLAGESATFTVAYTRLGLVPDGGTSWWLPRLLGVRRAQELILLNRTLSAPEALQWGLVSRVVPDEDLRHEAGAVASSLAAGSRSAQAAAKRLLDGSTVGYEQQMEREARAIVEAAATTDASEGIEAFMQKRRPTFS